MIPGRLRGPQLRGRPARRPGQKKTRSHLAPDRPGVVLSWCATKKGEHVGSRQDCTWILDLPGFRVVRLERDDDTADGSTPAAPGTAWDTTIRVWRLRATDQPGARRVRPHLGRPAVGGAPGDAGLSATARGRSPLWGMDGADRVCRPEGAGHAPRAPADRVGLPVDADQPRRRAAPCQLGQKRGALKRPS